MEISTCELDAQLLEKFSALGTTDKDDLVQQLRSVVDSNMSTESCSFFLELAGWNLHKAVGAYFDFSFENTPASSASLCTSSNMNGSVASSAPLVSSQVSYVRPLFDLRIWPSPSSSEGSPESFRVTVENSGSSPWKEGLYLRSESLHSVARLATFLPNNGTIAWLPLGTTGNLPLPPVPPGQFIELSVRVNQPSAETSGFLKQLTGALSFCLPTGEVFGETLYCTATLDPSSQIWTYQRGVPEKVDPIEVDTEMEEF